VQTPVGYYCCHDTPIGPLLLAGGKHGLWRIAFPDCETGQPLDPHTANLGHTNVQWRKQPTAFDAARAQLDAYFAGKRQSFTLALAPAGSAFQRRVWAALQAIPYGQTRSYQDIACAIGQPAACRAVGMANHRNPLPIVIPCHRVIGKNGRLTGFAGGLTVKRSLLQLEGCDLPSHQPSHTPPRHP